MSRASKTRWRQRRRQASNFDKFVTSFIDYVALIYQIPRRFLTGEMIEYDIYRGDTKIEPGTYATHATEIQEE